tara:strand:+ start:111 stop:413 length:303 start_codon:yes stop_codon:yes gene_type:complete
MATPKYAKRCEGGIQSTHGPKIPYPLKPRHLPSDAKDKPLLASVVIFIASRCVRELTRFTIANAVSMRLFVLAVLILGHNTQDGFLRTIRPRIGSAASER